MSHPKHEALINCVVAAYLDYLEGAAPRPPNLDELPDDVRGTAVEVIELIELLRAMRGVDLDGKHPRIGPFSTAQSSDEMPVSAVLPVRGAHGENSVRDVELGRCALTTGRLRGRSTRRAGRGVLPRRCRGAAAVPSPGG